MKINSSYLFHFFSAINLFALSQISKAQSLPDIIYENASNNTWVLKREYSNAAFCEYDVCHAVLVPTQKQWVAFSQDTGNETIVYDICATGDSNAIVYQFGRPKCMIYSGAFLNVTSTINDILVFGNKYVDNIQVNKVKENQTDSEACLDVFDIKFNLSNTFPSSYPTLLPLLNLNTTSLSNKPHPLNTAPLILAISLFTLACCSLLLLIAKKYPTKNKETLLEPDATIGKTSFGLFSSIIRTDTRSQQAKTNLPSLV